MFDSLRSESTLEIVLANVHKICCVIYKQQNTFTDHEVKTTADKLSMHQLILTTASGNLRDTIKL